MSTTRQSWTQIKKPTKNTFPDENKIFSVFRSTSTRRVLGCTSHNNNFNKPQLWLDSGWLQTTCVWAAHHVCPQTWDKLSAFFSCLVFTFLSTCFQIEHFHSYLSFHVSLQSFAKHGCQKVRWRLPWHPTRTVANTAPPSPEHGASGTSGASGGSGAIAEHVVPHHTTSWWCTPNTQRNGYGYGHDKRVSFCRHVWSQEAAGIWKIEERMQKIIVDADSYFRKLDTLCFLFAANDHPLNTGNEQ